VSMSVKNSSNLEDVSNDVFLFKGYAHKYLLKLSMITKM